MGTFLLSLLLCVLLGYAIYRTAVRARKGSSCCGEHEAAVKKVQPRDRERSHYPYELEMKIGGMTCSNCAQKVENALNSLDGTWAKVRIDTKTAVVRTKERAQEQLLRQAVREAGYVPLEIVKRS